LGVDFDFDPLLELLEPEPFPPPFALTEKGNWSKFKSKAKRKDIRDDIAGGREPRGQIEMLRTRRYQRVTSMVALASGGT
jgi:hypothetical protein